MSIKKELFKRREIGKFGFIIFGIIGLICTYWLPTYSILEINKGTDTSFIQAIFPIPHKTILGNISDNEIAETKFFHQRKVGHFSTIYITNPFTEEKIIDLENYYSVKFNHNATENKVAKINDFIGDKSQTKMTMGLFCGINFFCFIFAITLLIAGFIYKKR